MKGMRKPVTAAGSLLAGAALAALIAVSAKADSRYLIDADVWSAYQRYADAIGSTRPGAFAITEDGSDFWYVNADTSGVQGRPPTATTPSRHARRSSASPA